MSASAPSFIHGRFAEYYQKSYATIKPPQLIESREFGFLLLKEGMMVRHRSFKNAEELRFFLRATVPSHAYYSSAYYEEPEKAMGEKGWLGADLVFDIDADHIPTPCGKAHDKWTCGNCGFVGKGEAPNKCPSCGQQKFDEEIWPCEVCLESAKTETLKLLDMLTNDFGLSAREIHVGFSGHRGYHVHVENEEVRELDSMGRKEIVDYVMGIGLAPGFHGLEYTRDQSGVLAGPRLHDSGWGGRIAKGTYGLLLSATPEKMETMGLRRKAAATVVRHKDKLLESWKAEGPWGAVVGMGLESWKKIAQQGAEMQAAEIDTVVTTDIHRLIRLTNTLHGKTGLKKVEVSLTSLEDFDPFKEAVAFNEGTATLSVSDVPKFRIGEEVHGPYKKQTVELPTAAALFLLCKGAAEAVS